jgi:hypothetical protein
MRLKKSIRLFLTLLITFGSIISFSNCTKDIDEMEYINYYVDQDLIDKYYFEKGSLWVYKDQNLNLDSITVENTEHGFKTTPCPHGCPGRKTSRHEYFIMNLRELGSNSTFNYYFLSGHFKINGGGIVGELGQPIYLHNSDIGYSFNGTTVIAQLDSLNINENTYFNVTKIKISALDQIQDEFNFDTELYFSENIGLIKKVVFDTINGAQTKLLIDYTIK